MKHWLRRFRGALGMGLTWGIGWAPLGVLLGFFIDRDGSMDEMWLAIAAYPGFLCGLLFSLFIWRVQRGYGFGEISFYSAGGWGAISGALVGVLPFLLGTPRADLSPWLLANGIIASITALSALSAIISLALVRTVKAQQFGRFLAQLWAVDSSGV